MKTKVFLSAIAILASCQFPITAVAEPLDDPGFRRAGRYKQMLANLTPEERTKLRTAHHKAMADPAVQAAKDRLRQAARDFRDLKRQTMLRGDPTIQPILDKLPQRDPRDG